MSMLGVSGTTLAVLDSADSAVTISRTAALALLSATITVNSGTNTVTVNASCTLDDLHDAVKAWGSQAILAQLEFPTSNTYPVTSNGSTLNTTMNVVVGTGAVLSAGARHRTLVSSGTVTITGGTTVASYTGSGGTFVRLTVSGMVAGSSAYVERTTGSVELLKVIGTGTSESAYVSYTVDEGLTWRVRKQGYVPLSGTATLTASGATTEASQVVDLLQTGGAIPSDFLCDYVAKKIRATGTRESFTCQELVDIIRRCEATIDGIKLPIFANITGKVDLGSGVTTAITIELVSPWQIFWASGSVPQATISGGNLVGGIAGDPVEDVVGGPQITISLSASATIVDLASPAEIAAAVWGAISQGSRSYGAEHRDAYAVLLGATAGRGSPAEIFKDPSGAGRVTSNNDGTNRTSVVVSGS
jgi:hypothetical protein